MAFEHRAEKLTQLLPNTTMPGRKQRPARINQVREDLLPAKVRRTRFKKLD